MPVKTGDPTPGYMEGFFRSMKDRIYRTTSDSPKSRISDTHSEEGVAISNCDQQPARVDDYNAGERELRYRDENYSTSSPTKKLKDKKKKEIVSSSSAVPRVEVCTGKKCKAKGSEQLLDAFQEQSSGRVEIAYTTCMKACKQGMNVRVTHNGTSFEMQNGVNPQDCQQILCKHFDW